jgi:hypothetical protein
LIHGMQPSNHDDLQHLSVESISLRSCSSPPSMAARTTLAPFVPWIIILPETSNQWSPRTRIKHSTHTCVVITFNRVQWSRSHSPLHMSVFIG